MEGDPSLPRRDLQSCRASLSPGCSPTWFPVPHPAPRGQGLAEGLGGVGVGGGLSPCEVHVERRAGEGSRSGCQSVPGSLVPAGKIQEPCLPSKERASCPVQGRCVRWMGGQGTTLSPPLWHLWGSGGCLQSGSSLSQDCAPPCPPGFRVQSAAWIWAPAVTVKAGPGM